jgi:hypothetical protein
VRAIIFILILISGAYFLKFWSILKCQNPKPVFICGWKLSRVLWEMPGFGGKCPLPDLGATVRVSLKNYVFFLLYFTKPNIHLPPPWRWAFVSCNIANTWYQTSYMYNEPPCAYTVLFNFEKESNWQNGQLRVKGKGGGTPVFLRPKQAKRLRRSNQPPFAF